MLTALNGSCICTGFYMQTVPGVGGPQASEHWNTLTPAQDTTGQNHGPPADHVQSLGLGMCTPNPYWARDNRTTGISGTCTNRTDKHTFPIQREAATAWTVFTLVCKDQSWRVPFFPLWISHVYLLVSISISIWSISNLKGKNHLLISQLW